MLPNLSVIVRIAALFSVFALVACGLLPADGPKGKPGDVYLQLGIRYLDLNRLELAKKNLQKAVELEPDNARAYSALAFLNEKINHFEESRKYYEIALGLAPDDISVQNNYGKFLCERREFDRGLALLKQAISNLLNDRPWIGYTNAARCHLLLGQRPEALNLLNQALDVNTQYPAALFEMQKISYQMGEYKAAKDYLQRYLTEGKHTAETLWIAYQTEQTLGNFALANEYRALLLEKFPLSNEAKQVAGIR
jgi:type IV pilus assembly protein PilF